MSLWDNTPTTLTSFGPISSEVQSSGNFLSRLFKRGKDESDQSSDGSKRSSREVSLEREVSSREQSVDRPVSRKSSIDSSRDQSVDHQGNNGATISQISSTDSPKLSRHGSLSQLSSDTRSGVKVSGSRSSITREDGDTTRRTLGSVLTRLSAIVERRAPVPQVYRDSDFKQYWMPDSSCRECYECSDKFTTFRRRHHCRVCGQIFCNACCCQELPGKIIGYKGSIRVCKYCFEIVHQYALRADPTAGVTREVLRRSLQSDGAISPDQGLKRTNLDLPQRSLSLRSPSEGDISSDSLAPFDLTPQTELVLSDNFSERKLLIQDSYQLKNLWTLMMDAENGLEFQSYRVRLRTYQKCVAGNRMVDWLLKQDKAANRVQAIAIGQALIDAAFLDPLHTITTPFRDDFTLYRPTEMPTFDISPELRQSEESLVEDSAPQWFQDIKPNSDQNSDTCEFTKKEGDHALTASQSCSDISEDSRGNIKVDERHFDDPLPQQKSKFNEEVIEPIFDGVATETEKVTESSEVNGSTVLFRTLVMNTEDPVVKETFDKLQQEHHEHLTVLTKQLLYEENLSTNWADIIISTVDRVSLFVKPQVKENSDDMDIRKYVHIKKIPGGTREQTVLVHGVVFKKNVAHKKMVQKITDPGVLLLQGSIEYQRVENKMSYLEPQILQEEEYLWKNVKKITSLKPRPAVLVVEKSVSRLAQDFLLKAGITLIYNVKQTVMMRLSRFLMTDISTSIDSLVGGVTRLGFCHTFSVKTFTLPSGDTKNMIYFDGCANHLGCAIILRGGSGNELKRVKRILNFMIYASYHSRLEISFCMDEFLKPPQKESIEFEEDLSLTQSKKKSQELAESENYGTGKNGDDNKPENVQKDTEMLNIPSTGDTEENDDLSVNSTAVGPYPRSQDGCDSTLNSNITCDTNNTVVFTLGENENLDENMEKGTTDACRKEEKLDRERTGSFIRIKSDTEFKTDNCKPMDQSESLIKLHSTVPNQSNDALMNSNISKGGKSVSNNDISNVAHIKFNLADRLSPHLLLNTNSNPEFQSTNKTPGCQNTTPELLKRDLSSSAQSTPELRKKHASGGMRDKSPSTNRKSATTQLTDNSDPLNNYQISQDESIFQSSMALQEQLVTHRARYKKSLDNMVLSTSPYIKYTLPYLETEVGSKCELRKYFPEEIYWSPNFSEKSSQSKVKCKADIEQGRKCEPLCKIEIKEPHDFIRCPLTFSAEDLSTQHMLARFRAYGGRINLVDPLNQYEHKAVHQSRKQKDNQANKGRKLSLDVTKRDNSSERRVDCLDPFRHQRIAVLFSSFSYESENHPSPCVYPWVVTMEFYGRNDTTLGEFLERFCFRPSYNCPSDTCETTMDRHIRRFVHGRGCISLVLKRSTKERPMSIGNNIQMWSWCHRCKQATPRVAMSPNTWNLSFSRYLEFRFHGSNFKRRVGPEPICTHSLHHENFQYFGLRDTVASFKYSSIKMKEIKVPPLVITHQFTVETIHLYRLKDEVKRLTMKITEVFSSILDYMINMETSCDNVARLTSDYTNQQQNEKMKMRDMAHTAREMLDILLTAAGDTKVMTLDVDQRVMYGQIEDGIVDLKKTTAESVVAWNAKLQDICQLQKKAKQGAGQKKEKDRDTVSVSAGSIGIIDTDDKNSAPSLTPKLSETDGQIRSLPQHHLDDMFSISGSEFEDSRRKSDFSIINMSPPILLSPPPLSMEESIEKMTETADIMETRAPAVTMETDEPITAQDPVHDGRGSVETFKMSKPEIPIPRKSPAEDPTDGTDKIGAIKKSLINTIWQGSGAFQLPSPFDLCDHHLLPACHRVPVVVYDHEPSSIIAYSLSSHDYHIKLHDIHTAQRCSNLKVDTEGQDKMPRDDSSISKRPSSSKLSFFKGSGKESVPKLDQPPDTVRFVHKTDGSILESPQDEADAAIFSASLGTDSADKNKNSGKQPINHHIELQFADSTARFYCKVYFADQFKELRKKIFPDGEDVFIRSLCRCKPWEAKGGKSGSTFCKTDDDRFILKQMSNMEVESFERFGPEYFQYFSCVEKQQRPTTLAKILGVYRIGFRNQQTNNASKQDLIVMENLFYNRCISQTFDLKGSERNRLVKQTRKFEEVVLLDENFLRVSVDTPLYILPHSKTMLMLAISHDSQFLSSNLVMDYSLLVGVDEQNKELVVGIIDYIRTFTWDKKLETILKSNFGGQGKMPTVVSPEVYRTRFLDAMAKYFLPVPDQWSGLGRDIDH